MSDSQVLMIENVLLSITFEHVSHGYGQPAVEIEEIKCLTLGGDLAPMIAQGMDYIESKLLDFLANQRADIHLAIESCVHIPREYA